MSVYTEIESKSDFYMYGVVNNPNLITGPRVLFIEINRLLMSSGEDVCRKTNRYFAEFFNVNKITVSRWVKMLVDNNIITSNVIRDEETAEVLERELRINADYFYQVAKTFDISAEQIGVKL